MDKEGTLTGTHRLGGRTRACKTAQVIFNFVGRPLLLHHPDMSCPLAHSCSCFCSIVHLPKFVGYRSGNQVSQLLPLPSLAYASPLLCVLVFSF
ncbi:hypothetical protein Cadr_000009537 [Camelus dromedarius]|uniref:Uncharacterized protein n=1 Tax=Camelus dromedarius TaxID=9838 RepID=A0A5N4DJC4_CAMDR|nr:hypothetical protein Cadr_000009537 [Camelus dromedarius]